MVVNNSDFNNSSISKELRNRLDEIITQQDDNFNYKIEYLDDSKDQYVSAWVKLIVERLDYSGYKLGSNARKFIEKELGYRYYRLKQQEISNERAETIIVMATRVAITILENKSRKGSSILLKEVKATRSYLLSPCKIPPCC